MDKPIKVPELEMHRAVYQMFKEAGWESPEECLSAYGNLEARLASQERALGLMRDALAEIRAHQLLVTKGQFVERSAVYAIADRALKIDGDLND